MVFKSFDLKKTIESKLIKTEIFFVDLARYKRPSSEATWST